MTNKMKVINELKSDELYTCRYDCTFKTIMFEYADILEKVLETVLERPVEIIEYVVQDLPVRHIKEKEKTVDIIVKSNDEYINVEVNTSASEDTKLRNLNYFFSFMSQKTLSGEVYDILTKYIQINLNFDGKMNVDAIEEYKLRTNEGKEYYNNIVILVANMDKIMKMWYDKDDKAMEKYKYLMMLDIKKKEDLEKFCEGDTYMEKYKERIVKLHSDKDFVYNITKEQEIEMLRNSAELIGEQKGIKKGIKQGMEQGIKQGVEQKAKEAAKEMLKLDMPIDVIAKVTKLSVETIEALQNKPI